MKLITDLKKNFELAKFGPNGIRSIPDSKLDLNLLELKSRFDRDIKATVPCMGEICTPKLNITSEQLGMNFTTLEPTVLNMENPRWTGFQRS